MPVPSNGGLRRRGRMPSETFKANSFLIAVRDLRKSFGIARVKKGNDRDRRRITKVVVDEFLRAGGDVHQAFFLEANMYWSLKSLHLTCDQTPEERRIGELGRKRGVELRGFNPLKLVSESFKPKDTRPYRLTEAILKILAHKEDDNGISRDNPGGGAAKTSQHLQEDPCLFKKQRGPSLYRADEV